MAYGRWVCNAPFVGLAVAAEAGTFAVMSSLTSFAARFRSSPDAAIRPTAPASGTQAQPLLVLRGVSRQGTIRAEAARVIAVTALHFGTRGA
jgi:hypothetical protein